jgi:hypothetical protein
MMARFKLGDKVLYTDHDSRGRHLHSWRCGWSAHVIAVYDKDYSPARYEIQFDDGISDAVAQRDLSLLPAK